MKKRRLLFAATAGGHLSEALALFEPVFLSDEFTVALFTEKTSRKFSYHTYMYSSPDIPLVKLILGFFYSIYVLLKFKPDWVISTGAEVGVGAILTAKLMRKKNNVYRNGHSLQVINESGKNMLSIGG